MKSTQIVDLLSNIKNSFVSFFSILMFVALGVGVFLGISWAGPALENAADGMFNEGAFHHYQIQYPYGLTDDDIEKLSKTEGVTKVEAERQSFQTIVKDKKKYTVKVQSLGQSIDTPLIVEGKLPAEEGEIAFHAESAKQMGLKIGDEITFEKDADEEGDSAAKEGESKNTSGMKYLMRDTFKITALVNSADYIALASATYGFSSSPSGDVNGVAWVSDSVFDASAFRDGYPIVNVISDGLAGMMTFSEEYKEASDQIKEPIEKLGSKLATARYDDLHDQIQKKIDEGQAKIDEAEARIAQGEKDIAEGEQQLEAGRIELEQKRADGQAQLDSAYNKLMDAESKKKSGEKRLNEAYAKVDAAQQAINQVDNDISTAQSEVSDAESYKAKCDKELADKKITEKEYNKKLDERGAQANSTLQPIASRYGVNIPTINHENYDDAIAIAKAALSYSEELPVTVEGEEMTLGEARQRLADANAQLSDAQAAFDKEVRKLNDGWAQYNDAQAYFQSEVAQAEQAIADGEARIEEAKKQVEDGKKQIAENKPILEDARAKLAEMVKYEWTVMPRAYNAGSGEITTFSDVTDNLSISMAALFIIVGLLVSYFAVSRIVREQITQIGTKKALGFRQGEITSSFLWYSGIAVVVGAIIGALLAYFIVEGIIGSVLGGMFAFGAYPAYFGWGLCLIIAGIELLLVLGATYLACRKILKENAVELLRGESPPTGKTRFYEKWGIWEKLPLFIQTIVNNCVNDKRRVLSTIVGVAGCTALIVTAITLSDDVMKSYDRQYEQVYGFNVIAYAENEPEDAVANIDEALEKQGCQTAQVYLKRYLLMQPNGESGAMRVIVPKDHKDFEEIYHVNSMSDEEFSFSGDGAWVSQAYAKHFGAEVGDVITIDGGDGVMHEIPILGIYEFWLTYNEMVINEKYFEKEFGETEPNVVLCHTGEKSFEEAEKAVAGVEGFNSIVDDAVVQHGDFETFSSVSNAVVLIYLILAILMAIVVLLNLNVMFIAEKKRELIVLMINGFSVKDARHYISYDSIVLTVLGIIVGILLGCIMGSITVMSIEPITAVFVKAADGLAIAIGIAGSAILAIIMGIIALRRINKFVLTDINRF